GPAGGEPRGRPRHARLPWQTLTDVRSPPLGLYVHIPFCEAKCTYCHFAIDTQSGDARQERYLHALLAEIGRASPDLWADTIYFGGGTPSLFALSRLAAVIQALSEHVQLAATPEITVEANPRDLDAAGYAQLRSLGVTRLSLGVQTLDEGVRREMGRLHTSADALHSAREARGAGFDNLSVDLILGWPGETPARWRRSVDGILALEPEHVSLYVLEVEGKTVLSHRQRRGVARRPRPARVGVEARQTGGAAARAGG